MQGRIEYKGYDLKMNHLTVRIYNKNFNRDFMMYTLNLSDHPEKMFEDFINFMKDFADVRKIDKEKITSFFRVLKEKIDKLEKIKDPVEFIEKKQEMARLPRSTEF